MKRIFIATILILGIMTVCCFAQTTGQDMMGGQGQQQSAESPHGGWYPPCRGGGMMGHGMIMGGQGMMGGGMMDPGMQQQQPQPQKSLEEKDARTILENYIQTIRNPNLKLGKVKDLDYAFEAEIVTKENSLVDKIIVDKKTGWMRSAY